MNIIGLLCLSLFAQIQEEARSQIIGDIDSIRLRLRTYLYDIMEKKLIRDFINGIKEKKLLTQS